MIDLRNIWCDWRLLEVRGKAPWSWMRFVFCVSKESCKFAPFLIFCKVIKSHSERKINCLMMLMCLQVQQIKARYTVPRAVFTGVKKWHPCSRALLVTSVLLVTSTARELRVISWHLCSRPAGSVYRAFVTLTMSTKGASEFRPVLAKRWINLVDPVLMSRVMQDFQPKSETLKYSEKHVRQFICYVAR